MKRLLIIAKTLESILDWSCSQWQDASEEQQVSIRKTILECSGSMENLYTIFKAFYMSNTLNSWK